VIAVEFDRTPTARPGEKFADAYPQLSAAAAQGRLEPEVLEQLATAVDLVGLVGETWLGLAAGWPARAGCWTRSDKAQGAVMLAEDDPRAALAALRHAWLHLAGGGNLAPRLVDSCQDRHGLVKGVQW
jgi:hypothetical protein